MRRIGWIVCAVAVAAGSAVATVVLVTHSSREQHASTKSLPASSHSAKPGSTVSATVRAQALCRSAFRESVVEAMPTTVGVVRESGLGVVGGFFRSAFPGVTNDGFATWCMLRTSTDCYDESALAAEGAQVHIASAGCGWPSGPPRAGPAYWTF